MLEATRISRHHPHLLLVINDAEPRKCAQSTSLLNSSQVTPPADSRSISIAKASPQGRWPYAIFRKCPDVVPHRVAKDLRSGTESDFKNAFNFIQSLYHMVMENQAPFSEFTKGCHFGIIDGMENQAADIRRVNLGRLIERDYRGNISSAARQYRAGQNYFSALLKGGKSFGEKTARKIESRLGLLDGQLDIPDSPLIHDHHRRDRTRDELNAEIDDLSVEERRETLELVRRLRARNRLRPTG